MSKIISKWYDIIAVLHTLSSSIRKSILKVNFVIGSPNYINSFNARFVQTQFICLSMWVGIMVRPCLGFLGSPECHIKCPEFTSIACWCVDNTFEGNIISLQWLDNLLNGSTLSNLYLTEIRKQGNQTWQGSHDLYWTEFIKLIIQRLKIKLEYTKHSHTNTHMPVSASKRGPKYFNLQPRTQNFGSESTYPGPTVTWYYPIGDIPLYLLKRSKKKQTNKQL